MIMGKNKKQYIGAIEDEGEAAQIYDWHAILTSGIRVRILEFMCDVGKNKLFIHERRLAEYCLGLF